jgi:phosphopantothenoylcysteine decarboxylase/phosphopantothenate--cysteine ligase
LGVSGGIAAYKAADLASRLIRAGSTVDVMLTDGAARFIQPLTFEALTGRPVYTDVFDGWGEGSAGHVSLARDADAVLIAPATANTIARLASGFTDDMIGAVALATGAPLLIAPAMEHHMWHHAATRTNVQTLVNRGAILIPPETGRLASGAFGDGRLANPDAIIGSLRAVLGRHGALQGRHVVVSAGGTREALDPVRYIGNRSSGRMGVAIAEAAVDAGAEVTIVATEGVLEPLHGMAVVRVGSAIEMHRAIDEAVRDADVLVMAAAVADFRSRTLATHKIKKKADQDLLTIQLVKNPDIVASIQGERLLKIGFAAETRDLLDNARRKLLDKGLAMIVANDAVDTIGRDRSTATFLFPHREPLALPSLSKDEVAQRLVAELISLISERDHGA